MRSRPPGRPVLIVPGTANRRDYESTQDHGDGSAKIAAEQPRRDERTDQAQTGDDQDRDREDIAGDRRVNRALIVGGGWGRLRPERERPEEAQHPRRGNQTGRRRDGQFDALTSQTAYDVLLQITRCNEELTHTTQGGLRKTGVIAGSVTLFG